MTSRFLPLAVMTCLLPWNALTHASEPPNDNARPPFMAVYKGSVNGIGNPYGAKRVDSYAQWLGRKVIWAEDGMPYTNWDGVRGGKWQMEPWGAWVKAVPGRRVIFSVPLVPGAWDGTGPKNGIDANKPVSLEEGAKGSYNHHYKVLAENLVKNGLGNSILRLGWEFNGGWYPWRVRDNNKAEAFAGYFREIVKTMRAVPGAEKLQFDWNLCLTHCMFDPEKAWPGDEYVDFIGLDVYDDAYFPNTYPYPKDASPEKIASIRRKVWDEVILNGTFRLNYWKKFAQKHKKPLSIPEWGVNNKPDGHGGGDNPYYIEQMHAFINDPANNVYYHSYFDYQAGDGHHLLAPKEDGTAVTEFPAAAAKFKELFALPEQR